jgi:SAM-dependent methyltransferase
MMAGRRQMADTWWQTFFDADYLRVWSADMSKERTTAEVEFYIRALGLHPGSRVLDAPCGYGRVSRPLAERGMAVFGVDQSQVLLDHAESTRGPIPAGQLRYARHDLRRPLAEDGFDGALNVFSSLGYGNEEDDLAVLETTWRALRPRGAVLVETIHRDAWAALLARDVPFASRHEDGTLALQLPRFDAVSGRAEITYVWQGPGGGGQKTSSVRIYAITELVRLLEQAGYRLRQVLQSPTGEPFEARGPGMGGRVAIVAERP